MPNALIALKQFINGASGQLVVAGASIPAYQTVGGEASMDVNGDFTIDHDGLTNFVGNEHVDHSAVDITSGAGLKGGGDITTTRTLDTEHLDNPKTLAHTAVEADRATVINYTGGGGVTLSLTAAATLGDGWYVVVLNNSSGDITIDPNAAETIDGDATLVLPAGGSAIVYCDGTNFGSVGALDSHVHAASDITSGLKGGGDITTTRTLDTEHLDNPKTLAYTAVEADRATVIHYSGGGGVTLGITAAATLGDGYYFYLVNESSGDITIDPNSAETIDGAATLVVGAGGSVLVFCDGSNFTSLGTGEQLTAEQVQDLVGAMWTGNTEIGATVAYQDGDGTMDITVLDTTFAGDTGSVARTPGTTLTVAGGNGITTSAAGSTVTVAADSATTTAEGVSERATQTEVNTGTDVSRHVTPETLEGATNVIHPDGSVDFGANQGVGGFIFTAKALRRPTQSTSPSSSERRLVSIPRSPRIQLLVRACSRTSLASAARLPLLWTRA